MELTNTEQKERFSMPKLKKFLIWLDEQYKKKCLGEKDVWKLKENLKTS